MASTATTIDIAEALSKRYRQAYQVAHGIIRFGDIVRLVSLGIGALIVLASSIAAASPYFGIYEFFIGLLVAMFVACTGWVGGTLMQASGQIMQASLDTAVNTSPLFDNELKAKFFFGILQVQIANEVASPIRTFWSLGVTTPPMNPMKTCSHCGWNNPLDHKFCVKCRESI